jgi:arginyl-tRNA--protein-N-Asp/Glu arginylyltransferase
MQDEQKMEMNQESFQLRHIDILLAHGWFRMGKYMFTVNHIGWHREIRVFWTRYQIDEIELPASAKAILKKSAAFEFECVPLKLNPELEELYSLYRKSVEIDTADTLAEVLFRNEADDIETSPFHSFVIEMRKGGKLVGAGIFDEGHNAIMGIVNFFDPEFRKYSPGKSLMLQKVKWASENRKMHYYPGYIAAGDTRFDYKLFCGKPGAEIFDPITPTWIPFRDGIVDRISNIQKDIIRQLNEPLWLDPAHTAKLIPPTED